MTVSWLSCETSINWQGIYSSETPLAISSTNWTCFATSRRSFRASSTISTSSRLSDLWSKNLEHKQLWNVDDNTMYCSSAESAKVQRMGINHGYERCTKNSDAHGSRASMRRLASVASSSILRVCATNSACRTNRLQWS